VLIVAGDSLERIGRELADAAWERLGPYTDGEVWARDRVATTRADLAAQTTAPDVATWKVAAVGTRAELDPQGVADMARGVAAVHTAHAWRSSVRDNPIAHLFELAVEATLASELGPDDPEWRAPVFATRTANTSRALGLRHTLRVLTDPNGDTEQRLVHEVNQRRDRPGSTRPPGREAERFWYVATCLTRATHSLETRFRAQIGGVAVHVWDTRSTQHPLDRLQRLVEDGHALAAVDGRHGHPAAGEYPRAIADALALVTGQPPDLAARVKADGRELAGVDRQARTPVTSGRRPGQPPTALDPAGSTHRPLGWPSIEALGHQR
jgi:hypothetical protein